MKTRAEMQEKKQRQWRLVNAVDDNMDELDVNLRRKEDLRREAELDRLRSKMRAIDTNRPKKIAVPYYP